MIITGIEVIRGNPEAVEVAPPGKLELTYGDTLRITTSFGYRGKVKDITLVGWLGQRGLIRFDPIISAEAKYQTPDSPMDFAPALASVDIPITADIAPKPDYDIQCKIKEHPEAGLPEVDNVIDIVGMPPTFTLLEETIYPYAYVYAGPYGGGIFTFRTDPFTPASWIAGRFAEHCEAEVRKAGGRVLETRVYVDRTPLLWTDWRIEIVGVPPATTGVGTSLGIVWWVAILLVILGLIALIVVGTWAWKEIAGTFKRKPNIEDVKPYWERETLIDVIGDFEAALIEKGKMTTPTPPADLEKKSDDQLRTYCDELAEMIVPPVPPNSIPIIIAGVAILGLGALAAYALGRPKETR